MADELVILNEGGQPVLQESIPEECGFAIRYTHSVALTPVTDYFYMKDGEIWLNRTEYKDFGAGLPFAPTDSETMEFDKNRIILKDLHIKVSPFSLRVGRVANHELLLLAGQDGKCEISKTIPLKTLTQPGKPLGFEGKP